MQKIILTLILTLGLSFSAYAETTPDLEKQVADILSANPDLVLNIVKANPELILDLAQQGADLKRNRSYSEQWVADMQVKKEVITKDRPTRGDINAPVKIIAFTDFTCSYCAQAAATVEEVLRHYNGKATYIFKQFPLPTHDYARIASEWFLAAMYQDQMKSWDFYANLFDGQSSIKGVENIKTIAENSGLDVTKLQADLKKYSKEIKQIIDEDMSDADKLGFKGTPYFLINDIVIRGAISKEDFITAVDLALANKK